ncbi:autophagy-related protein 28 [Colletotrichum spaethianum]|uniref:Autophagy-related protein 28 n=1 Tax=Colletotrichum spaethianum TaxID=700344 RepID=A0AA37NWI0_9PEZI|nr:autophagy-related protein 28 [Colletotrichum spaethianum]GKT41375.1 autophagy-related protein 28 [Colletotrichum spaethianum]
MSRRRSPSPADPWHDDPLSPVGSISKIKPKAMFAGPPPPIAASVLLQSPVSQARRGSRERTVDMDSSTKGMEASRMAFGSILFDHGPRDPSISRVDSVWRNLQHRERSLQKEVQRLLDMQATGLVSGSEPLDPSTGGLETWSDSGSSTPTGTFYSTATSKSRMMASLDPPVRATPRGDIIPVRQPKTSGPQGLRAARNGLRRALAALTGLKAEENEYIESSLSQRKRALAYLDKLDTRRTSISAELHSLADDKEEPLAKELRGLGEQHDTLGQEIREIEEKLVGMRNRQRWLERKMEDVRNRREAGLSGYRGALKEVEGEVASLLRQPPIEPLDLEVVEAVSRSEFGSADGVQDPPGGADFFRMIPARRTLAMAKDWWESETDILHKRKMQVDKDRDALNQGTELWQETIELVTNFEADLRHSLRNGGSTTTKGKQPQRAEQEGIEALLPRMGKVILELEEHMRTAERNSWNLLICAIGAELEAFREAESLLRASLPQSQAAPTVEDVEEPWHNGDGEPQPATQTTPGSGRTAGSHHDESDNEVPPDLLVSRLEEHDDGHSHVGSLQTSSSRRDSDNEVPPEFLAEHSNEHGVGID